MDQWKVGETNNHEDGKSLEWFAPFCCCWFAGHVMAPMIG